MNIELIAKKFGIEGEIEELEHITAGHINVTYRVKYGTTNYIIQRMNKYVFKNPVGLMENIVNVTSFIKDSLIKEGLPYDRYVLEFVKSVNDTYYYLDDEGEYWRCYYYVPESVTYNSISSLEVMESSGVAFGNFQKMLSTFDASKLYDTIPNFHNTIKRFENLKTAKEENKAGRFNEVEEIYNEYMSLKDIACKMTEMLEKGELPLRVTHNDTKCNNVLFDLKTNEALAVIDLDTVMPGLAGFDFGDSLRTGGSTVKEDESDLSKVGIDLDKFEAFTKGFLSKTKDSLTKNEIDTLALGAIAMTLECGSRFLADYLDGDVYFHSSYDKQNLVRAKCQLKLAQDMISKLDKMEKIVKELSK